MPCFPVIPFTFSILRLTPRFQTDVPQDDAALRIAGNSDIFTAALNGNISLVGDHITAVPSSVHKKNEQYDTASPNLFV
jgi:hypothetical protein